LFVLNKESPGIVATYGIGDIEVVASGDVGLEVTSRVKGKTEVVALTCPDREEREEVRLYLVSQAMMIRRFRASLI
jgi:hypothetical protein